MIRYEPLPVVHVIDLSRQCPLCAGADQHEHGCELEGKEHVYADRFGSVVNWPATFRFNGIPTS
jgi:hypothetical protein